VLLLALALLVAAAPAIAALEATIRGTSMSETLRATPAADRILGLGGNDKLYGLAGRDYLDGGRGADLLNGGPGNDRLVARDGVRDVLRCGSGRDTARVDAKDRVSGCEAVARPRPPVPQPPPPAPTITTTSLPGGTVGVAYSLTLTATGGTPGYAWALESGALPAGLALGAGGTISGTPTSAGVSTFTVRATDSRSQTDTQELTLAVASPPAPTITTTSLIGGAVGRAYSQALMATDGTPGYGWTLDSGSLPAGLALSSSGSITGIPTIVGSSTFTVRVTDSRSQTDTQELTITVEPPPPNCHLSYPTVCIPPSPPDLNCGDIPHQNFQVRHDVVDPDPHDFDGNKNGIGCET
jgi:Putative Ig domain/RTX calcium-binding nonapeptide repeat (4 copies)